MRILLIIAFDWMNCDYFSIVTNQFTIILRQRKFANACNFPLMTVTDWMFFINKKLYYILLLLFLKNIRRIVQNNKPYLYSSMWFVIFNLLLQNKNSYFSCFNVHSGSGKAIIQIFEKQLKSYFTYVLSIVFVGLSLFVAILRCLQLCLKCLTIACNCKNALISQVFALLRVQTFFCCLLLFMILKLRCIAVATIIYSSEIYMLWIITTVILPVNDILWCAFSHGTVYR